MTYDETRTIMTILKTAYEWFYANRTKDELQQALSLWHEMLQDYPVDVIKVVVKEYIATENKPPTIADINRKCSELINTTLLPPADAWAEFEKIISIVSYYEGRGFDISEYLTDANPLVVRVADSLGTSMVETYSKNKGIARGQFFKAYNAQVEAEKKKRATPKEIVVQLDRIRESKGLLEDKANSYQSKLQDPYKQMAERMEVI